MITLIITLCTLIILYFGRKQRKGLKQKKKITGVTYGGEDGKKFEFKG